MAYGQMPLNVFSRTARRRNPGVPPNLGGPALPTTGYDRTNVSSQVGTGQVGYNGQQMMPGATFQESNRAAAQQQSLAMGGQLPGQLRMRQQGMGQAPGTGEAAQAIRPMPTMELSGPQFVTGDSPLKRMRKQPFGKGGFNMPRLF